jgi:adenine deaminase
MHLDKGQYKSKDDLQDHVKVAQGNKKADCVIKNTKFLDVFAGRFVQGDIAIYKGVIVGTGHGYTADLEVDADGSFAVPGFIDAHVHIESSNMTPYQYQRAVMPLGTTTIVWDPHEIANVKGIEGIQWALISTDNLLMDSFIMLPSCVPSTSPCLGLETSGAELSSHDLAMFRERERVLGLGEMMNFPGVLFHDEEVLNKLTTFQKFKCDGHCPGLKDKDLNAYAASGISTDHESTTADEAREKLSKGIYSLIREGSCAKDADKLLPLLNSYTSAVLALCSDDRDIVDILHEGHINYVIDKALKAGHKPEDVFRIASFTPAKMYGLNDRGAIAPGYIADLCLIKPKSGNGFQCGMDIVDVFKCGQRICDNVFVEPKSKYSFAGKNINIPEIHLIDLQLDAKNPQAKTQMVNVIGMKPDQLLTDRLVAELPVLSGEVAVDIANDILKVAVFERHKGTGNKAIGFVSGFELKQGAIASSVNHDCHNVIAVGASDEALLEAIRLLIDMDGGIVVVDGDGDSVSLPLPIGGLMSNATPDEIYAKRIELKQMAKKIGCNLNDPFLQLAFLALPVIPSVKITDIGLVDVEKLKVIDVVRGE